MNSYGATSFQDEQTVRHQFDSLCKLALKSEVINYEKHMAYRQKYEVMLSELSEKELSRLFIMDEHEMEHIVFRSWVTT